MFIPVHEAFSTASVNMDFLTGREGRKKKGRGREKKKKKKKGKGKKRKGKGRRKSERGR